MENLQSINKKCSECQENTILRRGKCKTCIYKEYRKSEKWKDTIKNYRQSDSGKNAIKKYYDLNREKIAEKRKARALLNKKEKPEILPNPYCDCGKKSIAKGLCANCYQKKRNREVLGINPKKEVNISDFYYLILEKLNNGLTIRESCEKVGISRGTLYRKLSNEQKIELRLSKYAKRNNFLIE